MIAGHTTFASDQLFFITAKDFYSSDVINESDLISVMEKHATVVSIKVALCGPGGKLLQTNSNLPGTRELHDFLALRNHDQDAAMKVSDNCYTSP